MERVFLEDVARRGLGRFVGLADGGELLGLCHVGVNAVPSGSGCGAFAREVARVSPRMLIGEAAAVTELWERSSLAPAPAARGPSRTARLRPLAMLRQTVGPGCARRRRRISSSSSRPAPPRTSRRSESIRCGAIRKASAGARAPRSTKAAPGCGRRTASSASRPKPPPGRRRRSSSSRYGSTRRRGARGTARAGCAISADCCSSGFPRSASSSAPRTTPRSVSTKRSGCSTCSTTARSCSSRWRAIFLARHALAASNDAGLASYAAPGEGLTEKGVEQARALGELLAGEEIGLGVATELRRTQETLELALEGTRRSAASCLRAERDPLRELRRWSSVRVSRVGRRGGADIGRRRAAARAARRRPPATHPVCGWCSQGRRRARSSIGHALAVRYIVDAAERAGPGAADARSRRARPAVPTGRRRARGGRRAAGVLEPRPPVPRFRVVTAQFAHGTLPFRSESRASSALTT